MKITHVLALAVALLASSPTRVASQVRYDDWGLRNVDVRSVAYQAGLREGRFDARQNRPSDPSDTWRRGRERRDFIAGYNRGYQLGLSDRNRGWDRDRDDRDYRDYGYRSTNFGSFLASARHTGYLDGLNDGNRDRRLGLFRLTLGVNFRNADRGFDSRYLSRNQYQQQYRVGYEQGYRNGFRGTY